jgi:hypothetical protein
VQPRIRFQGERPQAAERNTLKQERISIDKVKAYLSERLG